MAALNPAYRAFVESEIARLGASHPVIRTQYCLEAVAALGRFLSPQQRLLLQGRHERLRGPRPGETYIAGIDVAGEDETAAGTAPRRDSTVVTIGRVWWNDDRAAVLEVVEHYCWTGRDHRSQFLAARHAVHEVWGCRRVVVDATGIGAGLASWLAQELSADVVEQFVFTAPSKSRLGFLLLGMINTGRCRVYAPDSSDEARALWQEVALARYEMRASEQLRFWVPESEGHDDYLVSVRAQRARRPRRRHSGRRRRGQSAAAGLRRLACLIDGGRSPLGPPASSAASERAYGSSVQVKGRESTRRRAGSRPALSVERDASLACIHYGADQARYWDRRLPAGP